MGAHRYAGREVSVMPGIHGATLMYQAAVLTGLCDAALTSKIYSALAEMADPENIHLRDERLVPKRRMGREIWPERPDARLNVFLHHEGILAFNYLERQHSGTVSDALELAITFSGLDRMARERNDTRAAFYGRMGRAWVRHLDKCSGGYFVRVLENGSLVENDDPTLISSTYGQRKHPLPLPPHTLAHPTQPTPLSLHGVSLLPGTRSRGSHLPHTPLPPCPRSAGFMEGSALSWSFYTPHDLAGVLAVLGPGPILQRMDELFGATTPPQTDVPDASGFIGHYVHGNEPTHHLIFWYQLLGKPDEMERLVRRAFDLYTTSADGLCGNDDAGQLSAWYVMVRLGLFPVDPLSPRLLRLRLRDRALRARTFQVWPDEMRDELRWLRTSP